MPCRIKMMKLTTYLCFVLIQNAIIHGILLKCSLEIVNYKNIYDAMKIGSIWSLVGLYNKKSA